MTRSFRHALFAAFALTLALLALALPALATADEVADALTQAQESYAAGDLNGTSAQITNATRALAGLQQQRLAAFLPEAPEGWTREVADSDLPGGDALPFAALIGVTAEASYRAPDGSRFSLTLAADNPLAMTMMGMLGNPQMMAMMGGVQRVNGQDMLVQSDSLAAMVGMRVLVQASGMEPARMQPVLERIDFAALAGFDR